MAEPVGAEIVVEQDAPFSTPTKRSRRVVKPSTKVRDTARQLDDTAQETTRRTRYATRTASIEGEADQAGGARKGGSSDGKTILLRVLELLDKSSKETAELKEAIATQNKTISEQQSLIRELQQEVRDTKAEVKHVHEQLEVIATHATTTPPSSYADVTRSPPSSQPSNIRTLSTSSTTPSDLTDTLFCTIDTSRVDDQSNQTTAGAIRTLVENNMRTKTDKASWRCHAVTPRNPDRIRIVCRDETEHREIKQLAETKLARGARLLRDELYPIKVDNVNRTAVLDEMGEVRMGATEEFGKENDALVAKISWLSRRDIPKAYGSMVVYLTKNSDARRPLSEGFFHAGGESGTTSAFERRQRPEQCYNCQEIVSHKAFQCSKTKVCGRCAQEGHHHSECTSTIPKCVPCGGLHESFSRSCRRLFPSRNE